MPSDAVVRALIDRQVKEKAASVLADMGLSVSDGIRLLMVRVAAEKALPFDVKVPNAETQTAINEPRRKQRFAGVTDLMAELNADD
jgi:DNA-damage-inducible protein J